MTDAETIKEQAEKIREQAETIDNFTLVVAALIRRAPGKTIAIPKDELRGGEDLVFQEMQDDSFEVSIAAASAMPS